MHWFTEEKNQKAREERRSGIPKDAHLLLSFILSSHSPRPGLHKYLPHPPCSASFSVIEISTKTSSSTSCPSLITSSYNLLYKPTTPTIQQASPATGKPDPASVSLFAPIALELALSHIPGCGSLGLEYTPRFYLALVWDLY